MKYLALIVALLAALTGSALALEPSIGSGELTSDQIVYTVPTRGAKCYITGAQVITNGTNDARIIVYDGLDNSGDVITEITAAGTDHYGGRVWTYPRLCTTGIYVDVNGTGASYIIEYIVR